MEQATEEEGHHWIPTETGMVNLTAQIAQSLYDELNISSCDAEIAAAKVLYHPIIKSALEHYQRTIVPSGEMEGREAF